MSLPPRFADGQLPKYTSFGCYPLYYVTKKNHCLCAPCASVNDEDHPDDKVVAYDANWEDASLHCDECSERIESAYAEDEVEGHDAAA